MGKLSKYGSKIKIKIKKARSKTLLSKRARHLPVDPMIVPVKYRKLRSKFLHVIFAFMIGYSILTAIGFAFIIRKRYLFVAARNPIALIFGIYLLSFMIATVLTVYVVRKVLKPIEQLNEASKQVSSGNFDIRIHSSESAEEIQRTFESFNKMVEAIGSLETLRNDFVANVSHEFKTPLAAISGYATLLLDDQITNDERKEYAEKILLSTDRLSKLTGNILILSKLENQSFENTKSTYRLDEQIRKSILMLEAKWEEKNINFDLSGMPDTTFCGSESMMQLVFDNLIGNAIKFSNNVGTITISITKDASFTKITVADNGIGMSEETMKHIFEKFYQGDTSHKVSGNGLGLALCKAITDMCGGSISVQSAIGKGSSFTVSIPEYSDS